MSSASLTVLKKNGLDGSRFPIENDNVYKLGPGLNCHLRFCVDKDVKTNYCAISSNKTGIAKIKKLSSYPVLLNNKDITSAENLQNGDVIRIGPKKFRWDSEMKRSDTASVSLQTKAPNASAKKTPTTAIRRRSSLMRTRHSITAETLSTWEETDENIVSSKCEIDNEKFTVSNTPAKPSKSTDDGLHMSCSEAGAHSSKKKTLSRIPVSRQTIESAVVTELVKTPVVSSSPLITPNIKAIKSARKKSASMRKSSDNIMQAKKWKISEVLDDGVISAPSELTGVVEETASEKENTGSSDELCNKHEETPKLRTSSVSKKLIANKSHTELKKVSKKSRRGSLPGELDTDSPVANKLTISAKTAGKDDLSNISQCEPTSLYKTNRKSLTSGPDSEQSSLAKNLPTGLKSLRRQSNTTSNNVDANEERELFPTSRRSLHTENRVRSAQVNLSLNLTASRNTSHTFTSQLESPTLDSDQEEHRDSPTQSDVQNSPPLASTSCAKTSTIVEYGKLSARESLHKANQLCDSSQSGLSENKRENKLLDISPPHVNLTKSSGAETNLLDATVSNSAPRNSSSASTHLTDMAHNVSGVGVLNDDLIYWQYSDCELDNILSETPEEAGSESENKVDDVSSTEKSLNDIRDAMGLRTPGRQEKTPKNELAHVRGTRRLSNPKGPKSPTNDPPVVFYNTAPMRVQGRGRKTPKKDLTVVRGVKRPLDSKSPRNDLTNVAGVKRLMKTPGRKPKTPKNDLSDLRGVKQLLDPKHPKPPKDDLSEVAGVKKLFSLPRRQNSPTNDLRDVKGVKRLLKTPGRKQKSPENDLSDVRGVKRLMNPRRSSRSPENDLTHVESVSWLFNSNLGDGKRTKTSLKTPKNDLTYVAGVKQLFEPTLLKSPENDLGDVRGVKQLFKRNKLPRNDLSDVGEIKNLFVTLEKLDKSLDSNEMRRSINTSSMDELFDELKYEDERTDSQLVHLRKSPLKTYERKAMSLSPVKRDINNSNVKSRYSERMVRGPAVHVQKWIEEQKALLSNKSTDNETAVLIPVLEVMQIPEVPDTESTPVNRRVLRTKGAGEVEQTLDAGLTPRTRSRRQQVRATDDTAKTKSPVTRRGRKRTVRAESTEIVEDSVSPPKVSPRKRGRPKASPAQVNNESVVPTTRRRGRPKKATNEKNEQNTSVNGTGQVSRDNSLTEIREIVDLKDRTEAKIESDDAILEKFHRKRNSRHVEFQTPQKLGSPVKKNKSKEETETSLPVKRGRNARKKVSEQEEEPAIVDTEQGTSKPVKRGRATKKNAQENETIETKENQGESQPATRRGRNARKKVEQESKDIAVNEDKTEKGSKSRRKQSAKDLDENDITEISLPEKPVRRPRAAKVTKEEEKAEEEQDKSTGKKSERKKRSAKTEPDGESGESNENNVKGRRKKVVAEEPEDAKPVVKRTRKNAEVQGPEEPVRKSTRTRRVKS